jgi:hypothetical protein
MPPSVSVPRLLSSSGSAIWSGKTEISKEAGGILGGERSRKPLCWKGSRHPSIVSARPYDNALAETTIGLFKTEAVGRGSPFLASPLHTIDDVEYATVEWVEMVQQQAPAQPAQLHPTRRIRGRYYAQPRRSSRRRLTMKPASNRDGSSRSAR